MHGFYTIVVSIFKWSHHHLPRALIQGRITVVQPLKSQQREWRLFSKPHLIP